MKINNIKQINHMVFNLLLYYYNPYINLYFKLIYNKIHINLLVI